LIPCKCGCGIQIREKDKKNRPHFFVNGHNSSLRLKELNPGWKGGRIKQRVGYGLEYWLINLREHPRSDKKGYILEHIVIMEKYLGRYLTSEEVVHHINGNGLDNRIENLQLFENNSEHMKHHASHWERNHGLFV
jgi:hypothetical protein